MLLDETFIAERSHESELMPLLQRARELVKMFDIIAVGLGPGSYAGIRIAIATAMGLQMALRSRLVGIPSVAALETDARDYLAVGDARRDTFYFSKVEEGHCTEGPLLLDETALRARLADLKDWRILVCDPLALLPSATIARPSALLLARLAAKGRSIVAEGALEPLYLREPHITLPKARAANP